MSDYDRFANARVGAGLDRSRAGAVDEGLRAYMLGVYNYMTLGLGVTGLVAWAAYVAADVHFAGGHAVSASPFGQAIYFSALRWVIVLSPLALVFFISARINAMSVSAARTSFLVFAGLIGLSMSSLLVVYTEASIGRVFFETAAAFGALSLYGYTTRRSLSAMGSFMMMGLFGLIIAMVVNMFLQSTGLQWALSIVGILIFAGLTAWDTQSIKEAYYAGDGYEASQKKAIYGALRLYLDFINMFQLLLMLSGGRRD
ncbi:MAG: Bax inhibitor-1/YccA family protein [Roseiarcus sp.]